MTIEVVRLLELVSFIERERRKDESAFDTFERLYITRLLKDGLQQKEMANVLGCTSRVVNYVMGKYGLRPVDRKTAATS